MIVSVAEAQIVPTPVGVNRSGSKRLKTGPRIVPTPVGVNRDGTLYYTDNGGLSPHPWG